MKKVLLISMPFCSVRYPAIGISLLKSRLSDEDIPCDIKYFNIVFAEMVGVDRYEEICENEHGIPYLGETLFAQMYFGNQVPDEKEYKDYLKNVYGDIIADHISNVFSIKRLIKPFLDKCLESVLREDYDVIGFSSMFEQNLSSIALAYRIKEIAPEKTIIFGGPNCEREMGVELHRRFQFIDYVCSGEADNALPELINRIRKHESVEDIPGLVYRDNNESAATRKNQGIENLDNIPLPDYNDYFVQLKQASLPSTTCLRLPMETSRGCWWGEKSQCRFCGLNGGLIRFRSKSTERVIKELIYLTETYAKKYNVNQVYMVDNVLDMKYFADLIPELKRRRLPVEIFYEVKANLNKEQVEALYEAGITSIQPGIESINTHVLRLMRKGVTSLQNIQLLKDCEQFGIFPGWSILTGFPQETFEDYEQMIKLIFKITHLPSPGLTARFQLERFSPYFEDPEKYGITNIRPEDSYKFIYPFEISAIFNLAYFFDFDYRDDVRPPDCDRELTEAVNYWQECYANNEYLHSIRKSPSTLLIEDGRSNARISRIVLESSQKDIYEYCDKIRTLSSVFSYVRGKYGDFAVRERDVKDFLDEMVSLNLMLTEDNKYLSIAIPVEDGYARRRQGL